MAKLLANTGLCVLPTLLAVYKNRSKKKSGWVTGIKDWQGLSKKITTHGKSEQHILACITFHQWEEMKRIDDTMDSERKAEQKFWNLVLERLIDITVMLAKNALAFRGSKEHSGNYDGNFLSTVQLLAKYDPIMAQVLSTPKGHTTVSYTHLDVYKRQLLKCTLHYFVC